MTGFVLNLQLFFWPDRLVHGGLQASGICSMLEKWATAFQGVGSLVQRLNSDEGVTVQNRCIWKQQQCCQQAPSALAYITAHQTYLQPLGAFVIRAAGSLHQSAKPSGAGTCISQPLSSSDTLKSASLSHLFRNATSGMHDNWWISEKCVWPGDYCSDIIEDAGVVAAGERVRAAIAALEGDADRFRQQFEHLSHLWTTPMQAALQVITSQKFSDTLLASKLRDLALAEHRSCGMHQMTSKHVPPIQLFRYCGSGSAASNGWRGSSCWPHPCRFEYPSILTDQTNLFSSQPCLCQHLP